MNPEKLPSIYDQHAASLLFQDTRELVKRHMQDPHHVITSEEIAAVQISTAHIDVSSHPLVKGTNRF